LKLGIDDRVGVAGFMPAGVADGLLAFGVGQPAPKAISSRWCRARGDAQSA